MAEGGEGEFLGFVFVLFGVFGGAGFDFGGEGHPEGADGGEFFGGGGAGEGEVVGVGEAVKGGAFDFGEALGEGVGEGDGLGIVHEEEALGGDVGVVALAVDEGGVGEVED